jgi:hypothetical protein
MQSTDFSLSQNPPAQSRFSESQILAQTRVKNHSCALISHKILTSQSRAQSQKPPPDEVIRSNDGGLTAEIRSSIHPPFSQNPLTQSPFTPSEIIAQTRTNINSDLLCSQKSPRYKSPLESQMQSSEQIIRSISVVPFSTVISSFSLPASQNISIESRLPKSQIIPQTTAVINSDLVISRRSPKSEPFFESQIQSGEIIRSISFVGASRVMPSVPFSRSQNCPSQRGPPMSEVVVDSKGMRSSLNATFSRLFNQNNERGSLQWFSSMKIEFSVFPLPQSQAHETSAPFLSNPLRASVSNVHSILFQTLNFLTPINNQLKLAVESVRITSGAAGGGALIALLTICCLCFALHGRHKGPEIEQQTVDEIDLPTELSEEE